MSKKNLLITTVIFLENVFVDFEYPVHKPQGAISRIEIMTQDFLVSRFILEKNHLLFRISLH